MVEELVMFLINAVPSNPKIDPRVQRELEDYRAETRKLREELIKAK